LKFGPVIFFFLKRVCAFLHQVIIVSQLEALNARGKIVVEGSPNLQAAQLSNPGYFVGGKKEEAYEGFRGMDNSDSNFETE